MTIHDFHSHLDPTVVDRGRAYFLENAVLELVKKSADQWTATVAGSEEYEVEVGIIRGTIEESKCNCPYDHGLVCKHEVAVFFAMREDLRREEFANSTGLPQKLLRSLPFAKQVEKVGLEAGKAELLDFIASVGETDREFREAFLIRFGDRLGEDPLARIQRHIDHIVRSASGSKSYLNLQETESVADALRALWERHRQTDKAEQTRKLILAALEEARKSAEDFEGYLRMLAEELS